ncbi:MAG: hypothetical protein IJ011_10205 [Clostridia bacterium]|nr:hypothetical protein [Clostridia bacterium]
MSIKDKTKRLAFSAILSALGVVLLYVGALISVLDISMAVIASICCIFAVIEYGGYYPWLIYAVTGVLSLLVLPQKEAAVMYILFFGFYPIIKEKLEKKKKLLSWILKEVIFNVALCVMLVLSHFLLAADASEPAILYVVFVILAEIAFPLYDLALTRMISLYIYKIRSKFKIK